MPARIRTFQANFTRGELSPFLQARETAELYAAGLEICENFMPLYHGGLTRRPGTRFVANTKYPGRFSRLITFEYSTEDTYVIEIGHEYMRFFRNFAVIEDPNNAGQPYELASPYTEEQLRALRFEQDDNSIFLVHRDHPPKELKRTNHADWSLSDISFTNKPSEWKAGNYPQLVSFFQQRSVFSATPEQPQTFWLSKSGEPKTLTQGTDDDSGFKVTLKSGGVNSLRFTLDGDSILVGTAGGTRVLGPSGGNGVMTIRSLDNKPQTETGVGEVAPIKIGSAALFVSKDRRGLHEMQFYFEKNRYESPALTELSEHITGTGVKELAYTQFPLSYVWMVRDDGQLVSVTYHRQQQVVSFARHKLGGRTADRDWGEVESITAAFQEEREVLWLSVKRRINGADVRHIEYMEARFDSTLHKKEDAYFVDCGGTYEGEPAQQVSGFAHLVGEQVDILADGAVLPQVTVAGDGTVTLPNNRSGRKITVGLHSRASLRSLTPPTPAEGGPGHGKKKRAIRMGVQLLDSGVLDYGPDPDNLSEHSFRTSEVPLGSVVGLYSGYLEIPQDDGFSDEGRVWIRAAQPLPLTIRAIVTDIEAEG
ncbi:hypothetical protein [Kiloniella sp. b19]|uniref:hypothetical protein n=1 Tax=Kiloniella sp. GXU_MW_B19 TaxID=3141326 RepID=UPI0031D0DA3A